MVEIKSFERIRFKKPTNSAWAARHADDNFVICVRGLGWNWRVTYNSFTEHCFETRVFNDTVDTFDDIYMMTMSIIRGFRNIYCSYSLVSVRRIRLRLAALHSNRVLVVTHRDFYAYTYSLSFVSSEESTTDARHVRSRVHPSGFAEFKPISFPIKKLFKQRNKYLLKYLT